MLLTRINPEERKRGLSLLRVEIADPPGYRVGRVPDKMGMVVQDTAELFAEDVPVLGDCRLGAGGGLGLYQRIYDLPHERRVIARCGVAAMEGTTAETSKYVKEKSLRPGDRLHANRVLQTRRKCDRDARGTGIRR
ncbi:MAG: hypothetical protein FJ160_07610 [Gammaproteobacteria bacterium]|nr:hypothetical protein [Gammaproteobacteria bacterium]